MLLAFLFLFVVVNLHGENYYDLGKKLAEDIQHKENSSQIREERELLRKKIVEVKQTYPKTYTPHDLKKNKCSVSTSNLPESETSLYVFVSFSLTDETWLNLSKEVEKIGGALVLRGLPNNSFKNLAKKLFHLRKQGVNATVKVDPLLFQKYNIDKVPCFVTIAGHNFDKVSGNITLSFALRKMENETAKNLRSFL